MSTMSAAGGTTTCSSGSGQGSCAYGSCIRGAQCTAGDYVTYCYSGGFVQGTCAYCVSGGDNSFDAYGCGIGRFSCHVLAVGWLCGVQLRFGDNIIRMYMLMTNCAVNMGLSNGFVWKVRGKAVSAQWCEELTAILGVSRATGGPDADLRIEQGKFRAGQPFDPSTLLELSSHGVASPRRSYVRAWSDLVLLRHEELAYVIAGLGEVSDREGRIDQMRRAMLPFYEAVAARGGLPLHAALAEIGGQGVILAGVSGAGKSTCCRRFPAPWRILSDDLAVVVPCEDGTLRAHPLPTWSAVKAQTVERPCVLQHSVPVRAIFFLVHSDAESAVPVGAGRAALSIYDAAMQVFMSVDFAAGIPGGSTYTRTLFENAAEMAAALPAFVLQVSLRGCFWECIERALDQVGGAVYKKRENNLHKLSAGKWGQAPL